MKPLVWGADSLHKMGFSFFIFFLGGGVVGVLRRSAREAPPGGVTLALATTFRLLLASAELLGGLQPTTAEPKPSEPGIEVGDFRPASSSP